MTRAEFMPLFDRFPDLTVKKRDWLCFDQPELELELELSDGSFVKVGWDDDYNHRLLYIAANEYEDFVSATADQTGLSEDVLAPLVDEVCRAVREHNWTERAEYPSDERDFGDGR